MLELDIVLRHFIEVQYHQLGDAEKITFEAMLEMSDNALWDMISGKLNAESNEQQKLLELIQSV